MHVARFALHCVARFVRHVLCNAARETWDSDCWTVGADAVELRDEQFLWYDEEKRTVTMYSRPWTNLPILGRMQWSKLYLSATDVVDPQGTPGIKVSPQGDII